MSSRKAIACSVNLALIIAGLVVAVCYFTLLHPSILDYVTYKRLPAIQHRVSTPGGAGYSIYPWVGRCGWAPHTLTLFETKIADFPTLFKTEFRFLIPSLRHS